MLILQDKFCAADVRVGGNKTIMLGLNKVKDATVDNKMQGGRWSGMSEEVGHNRNKQP